MWGEAMAKVRLRDIPPNVLTEIRRFVRQYKGKIPVTGGGPTPSGEYVKNMQEIIKEKWGYELSPGQIFALQRPRPKKVSIPEDVAEWMEKEFGSVGDGVKRVTEIARIMSGKVPDRFRQAIASLGGRTVTYDEAVMELRMLGYDDPDEVLRELARLGFMANEAGKLRFYRYRRPPEFSILRFFGS
jgi:hypothetical protein